MICPVDFGGCEICQTKCAIQERRRIDAAYEEDRRRLFAPEAGRFEDDDDE